MNDSARQADEYKNMLERTIAKIAHRGQKYGTADYFTAHVERVVANVEKSRGAMYLHIRAAYLHDVLEDTAFTADDLLGLGVSADVVRLVQTLTRNKHAESYAEYIRRIATDRNARLIKLADLRANLAENPPGALRERYLFALVQLSNIL